MAKTEPKPTELSNLHRNPIYTWDFACDAIIVPKP